MSALAAADLDARKALAGQMGPTRGELLIRVSWQRTATSKGVVDKAPKGQQQTSHHARTCHNRDPPRAQSQTERGKARSRFAIYHDRDYVFCREDGEPYYPKYFTDHWAKSCAVAGVPVITVRLDFGRRHDGRDRAASSDGVI